MLKCIHQLSMALVRSLNAPWMLGIGIIRLHIFVSVNNSDLGPAGGRQKSSPLRSFAWHGEYTHPSILPSQSQASPVDHQPRVHTQAIRSPITQAVGSTRMRALSVQSLESYSGLQLAPQISSLSSLPPTSKRIFLSAHVFDNIRHPSLLEAETSDRNPPGTHTRSPRSVNETRRPTDVFWNASTLMARFGIARARDMLKLSLTDAIEVLDQIYINLQNHAPGSVEYPHMLRLLQDCCSHAGTLPTQLGIRNVTFNRSQFLNRGGEAMLYKGRMDGHNIVVRELTISTRDWKTPRGHEAIQRVHREAIIHSQLRHPNILPFLGIHHEEPGSPPLVILPFHEHGSLQRLLADLEPGGLIKLSDLIRIVRHASTLLNIKVIGSARGVVYLHSRTPPIIHGDLHPGNILLDDGMNPSLCDFGLSRIRHEISRAHSMHEEGGRSRFVAPELHDSSMDQFTSSQGSDVFALAMTFLNAWSSQQPFSEIKNDMLVVSRLIHGLRPKEPVAAVVLGPKITENFWSLLEAMWTHEVFKRPSSNKVLMELEHIFNQFKDSFPIAQTHIQSFNPHGSDIEDGLQSLSTLSRVRQSAHMLVSHDLQHLQYAQDANRLLWDHKPENLCLPGTRTAILKAILDWAKGSAQLPGCPPYLKGISTDKHILWLCGVAGSGKSSIALSVALETHASGILGAYYCFNTANQAQLNPSNLFSTIACQLAARDKATE
ncbi:kinase-like protein, partial [Clavulina sp. PMI_390]